MLEKFKKFNIEYKNFIFLIILLVIILHRSPYIFLEGRFIEEEGSFWYRNLFLNGQLDTLFFISNFSGYLNLWMNIAAFFSGFVHINYAPMVTVYFPLVLLMYIFFYILNSSSYLYPTNNSKYLGCMIILFSPVMTAEVWMNSLNTMSYLGIFAFLLIFEKEQFKYKNINFLLLLISGLSGYYASALMPVFFLKYFYFRKKTNLINFIIISCTSIIQFFITIYSMMINEIASERFFITFDKIINYSYNVILKPLFGRELLQKLISLSNYNFLILVFFIIFIIGSIVLFKIFITKKDYILNLIIICFLIESLLILFGSAYKDFVGGRYAVCVGVIFSFIFFRIFYIYKNKTIKILYGFIIFLFLSTGFLEFKFLNQYPHFLSCIDCPKWKNEVKKWELDSNYHLKIWTYPNQTMKLY